MIFFVDILLFSFSLVVALVIVRTRDLFAAAMLTGFFSLLSAGLYVVLDAVDVAFTEAAVGAGLSTVLLLSALSLTGRHEKELKPFQLVPLLLSVAVGGLMLFATSDMPDFGSASARINQVDTPVERYLNRSGEEVGIPNVVTSVLASYRGYDTFGETTVIFTAGLVVFVLLARDRGRSKGERS